MAWTAVSIEPCPVISAISVRGSSFFTFSRNSSPDMRGITMSVNTMCTDCSSRSASADSPLSASRQTKPSASPTVTHSLRIDCSSSTISKRMRESSLLPGLFIGLPKRFRNDVNKLLHAERLLHARSARFPQSGYRFLVRDIPRNKNDSRSQIRTVLLQPGVHLPSIYAAGRAHIRYHAEKRAVFEQAQGIHARFATDHGISTAFESGLNVRHYGGFILDEQHGQRLR